MKSNTKLDIGFWIPRPSRGTILAEKLRKKGHKVTIYHFNPIPGEQKDIRQINYGLRHTLELIILSMIYIIQLILLYLHFNLQ